MSSIDNIDWNAFIKKDARGIDGIGDDDLGEVQGIQGNNIITKARVIDKETYSIPKSLVDKFDGHTYELELQKKQKANTKYLIKY